ncbi:MAG: TIGR02147 family protein [Fibrobacterota bacterium]
MSNKSKIKVFDYTDFRKYLIDYYDEQKEINKVFSYRFFAKKAGFVSSGIYKDVTNGRRNISQALVHKFAKGIGLGKKEEEYFENMVYFCQAKTVDDRRIYFERMMTFKNSRVCLVEADKYEYYSKWYYSAIRAILSIIKFKNDYATMAGMLDPSIKPEQAKKAIALLLKLKLIKKNKSGFYKPVDNLISTGPEVNSLNVMSFHRSMIELAKEAQDRHLKSNRDISGITVSIDHDTFCDIKNDIINFRKDILNKAKSAKDVDRVYQLNVQFFPLSKFRG